MTEEVVNEDEKNLNVEKPSEEGDAAADGDKDVKEATKDEVEEKEPEDKVKE